jgi:DNA topoisomerase IA
VARAARGGGKSLVIVESPTKSRTLMKFLGRGYSVMASNGHIMDLPKSELGVDLENDFEPKYVPIQRKSNALAKIKTAAQSADRIFLAPDPDREGEAIAWHLAGALKSTKVPIQRLTFNEITERAVKQALEQPRALDMNLVNAQQARRVLDRLVGYKVSPFVWRTVRYGLSAGRVQSVALRLICEREDEIRAFVPVEYWTLEVDYEIEPANAAGERERFTARLVRVGEEELEQGQLRGDDAGARAAALAEELRRTPARIAGVETAPRAVHPRAPFITSTLQQTRVQSAQVHEQAPDGARSAALRGRGPRPGRQRRPDRPCAPIRRGSRAGGDQGVPRLLGGASGPSTCPNRRPVQRQEVGARRTRSDPSQRRRAHAGRCAVSRREQFKLTILS